MAKFTLSAAQTLQWGQLHYVVPPGASYPVVPVQHEEEPSKGRRWLSSSHGADGEGAFY